MFALSTKLLHRLRASIVHDDRGVAVVEFAFALPILCLFAFGAYDASRLFGERLDIQQAAADVTSLILAAPPGEGADTTYIKNAAKDASGLGDANVTVSQSVECNGTVQAAGDTTCDSNQEKARYVNFSLRATLMPFWTHMGIGGPVVTTAARKIRVA